MDNVWKRTFCASVQVLPSVQSQIQERAYQFYIDSGLRDAALEHWLAAENEVRRWIDSTFNYTVSGNRLGESTKAEGS